MFTSKLKLISIDIGSYTTKIIKAKYINKKVVIEDAFIINTPVGVYSDGHINDINSLKKEIKEALNSHNIGREKCIFISKSSDIVTREVTMPYAKNSEIQSMIKFQIERYLPIMPDDYIIQYKNIEEFSENNVKKIRIRIVAYPKVMSEEYRNLCKELDMIPHSLDITSNVVSKIFSICKSINGRLVDNKLSYGFLDIGSEYSTFTIIKNKKVDFTRLLSFGGSHIDVELSKQLIVPEKEAENEKIQVADLMSGSIENVEESLINDTIKNKISSFTQEVDRMIQFFKNKQSGNSLEKIYIYGGCSKIKGLDHFMSDILSVKVEKLKSIDSVDMKLEDLKVCDFINAAGAVIRL